MTDERWKRKENDDCKPHLVPLLELAHAADAEEVLQLQYRHRGDEQLAHDLRRVVVRVQHLVDDAVVGNLAAVELRVNARDVAARVAFEKQSLKPGYDISGSSGGAGLHKSRRGCTGRGEAAPGAYKHYGSTAFNSRAAPHLDLFEILVERQARDDVQRQTLAVVVDVDRQTTPLPRRRLIPRCSGTS